MYKLISGGLVVLATALLTATGVGANGEEPSLAAADHEALVEHVEHLNAATGHPPQEIEAGIAGRDEVAALQEEAARFDGFAGVWMDGAVNVAFVRGHERNAERATRNFPEQERLRLHAVRHSEADLRRVHATVDADAPDLRAHGVSVTLTAIDPRQNAVVIGVDGDLEDARRVFAEHDPAVVVVPQPAPQPLQLSYPCSGRDACWPQLRGGLRLLDSFTYYCSSGFEAVQLGQPVLLTAGHCFPGGLNPVTHQGLVLGSATDRHWPPVGGSGDTDAEVVQRDPNAWIPSNWIYRTDADRASRITRVRHEN